MLGQHSWGVPKLSLLLTETYPPIYSAILLHMLNPRPVPWEFIFLCCSSIPKLMKRLLIFSSDIPAPLSSMSILNFAYFSVSSVSTAFNISFRSPIFFESLEHLKVIFWEQLFFQYLKIWLCLSKNSKEFAYIFSYHHKRIWNIYLFITDLKGFHIHYLSEGILIELQITIFWKSFKFMIISALNNYNK